MFLYAHLFGYCMQKASRQWMSTLEDVARVVVTSFHPPKTRNIVTHVVVRSSLGRCRAILLISHSVLLKWNVQANVVMMMVDAGSVGRSPIQSPQIIPAPSLKMPIVSTLTITPVNCLVNGLLADKSLLLPGSRMSATNLSAPMPKFGKYRTCTTDSRESNTPSFLFLRTLLVGTLYLDGNTDV